MKYLIVGIVLIIFANCNTQKNTTHPPSSQQPKIKNIEDNGITNKYWKLKKLEGKEIKMSPNQEREQYFMIRDDGTLTGFSGCNQFSGNYILQKDKQKIKFENLLSTLRACEDAEINEVGFLKIFELTDNYTISRDNLKLNVGKRAPLAEFEAVYF